MAKTIQQTVQFSVSPEELFDIYLNSKKHSAAINSKAIVSRAPRGARIALVHANVPDKWHAMIQKGWQKYYWKPWKAYIRQKAVRG